VKLIPDLSLNDDEPLLPDSPRANLPWHTRLLRRGLSHLLSPEGLTVGVGLVLTLLLTVIISLGYLDVARDVDKNGISLKDFYADHRLEVVDEQATLRKIDRAITPIYQDAAPHNQDIMESLRKLSGSLGQLTQDTVSSAEARRTSFMAIAGSFSNAEQIYDRYFTTPISANDWAQISTAAQQAMERILKAGLTEAQADNPAQRRVLILDNIPRFGYPHQYRELVAFLVDGTLEPNRILDEKAMLKSREMLTERFFQDEPEIVVFNRGQKIVGHGEKVTPVQRAALAKMGRIAGRNNWLAVLGVGLLSGLFVLTLWNYLYHFEERQFFKPAYVSLLGTLTVFIVVFFQLLDQGALGRVPLYAFPLAAYAMMLSIFTHPHVAVLATTLLVFLLALAMRLDYYSVSVLLFGSYMGIYILQRRINFSDRGQLIYAGCYVGVTNALGLLAISLLKPDFSQDLYWNALLFSVGWGLFSGIFSGILAIGTLPLLESIFRVITPFTLMELGNHDRPLLKRMQFEAPGTFHHSLMVASLAETAAEAIGANALLTRVGCLYHDIGKMKRPLFFIENQAYFGVENPHDKLTPRLSKMVITAHPRDSIEMAKQHRLPEVLMKFMTEHHGTLTAGYFYNKACQEEGAENVNKSQFRYPGPKPGSKETAIVMLADACESAVRALKSPSAAQVEERIDKIIQQRIADGQFDNCPITFKDIEIIKQTFVRVLRGIQHNRIEYQQNMMRELGKKLPVTTVTEHAGLQQALKQVQGQHTGKKSDAGPAC
jgi:putative nucleotidyltransferase with HDIG domain